MTGALAGRAETGLADVFSGPVPQTRESTKPDALERAIAATVQPLNKPGGPLGRDQKAAIIVRLLLSSTSELPLGQLGPGGMTRLVRAMAGLTYVDEATILRVVDEFLADLNGLALYFKPGLPGALSLLEQYLDADTKQQLTDTAPKNAVSDPWEQVALTESADLAMILAPETPQVAALVLSRLSAAKAAELLAEMPPEQARAATIAASRTGRVDEKALYDIGAAIVTSATARADPGALPGSSVERVGAILNFTPGVRREDLLGSLETADAELAENIRSVMFTFEDIPDRVEVKDIAKVVRAVDNDGLVRALAGARIAGSEVAEFILSNLSKRLTEQLEEEIREIGEVKPRESDLAMNEVIAAINTLEAAGEITLISPEDESG